MQGTRRPFPKIYEAHAGTKPSPFIMIPGRHVCSASRAAAQARRRPCPDAGKASPRLRRPLPSPSLIESGLGEDPIAPTSAVGCELAPASIRPERDTIWPARLSRAPPRPVGCRTWSKLPPRVVFRPHQAHGLAAMSRGQASGGAARGGWASAELRG
ncbi:hypothetical protein BRADI_5g09623v3 [Brachypodium distachyon]|uniref:Uncharacterized protein n=1 Tax=Brachypodium distachyon TaxID=15368 RepID=A0A2K2CG99_BRADI|nr:hypothetical protein BRADI_5g09623v3 [Brachypodium distachyon]